MADAGGVRVCVPTATGDGADKKVHALVDERVASRLAARDATLWGAQAEEEASVRLGWVDLHES